jgi:hypothetical protein
VPGTPNALDDELVYRLACNDDVVRQRPDQLAVFKARPARNASAWADAGGATSIRRDGRKERATRKNSQTAEAQRVALKMGRRLPDRLRNRFRYAPSYCRPDRTALPGPF